MNTILSTVLKKLQFGTNVLSSYLTNLLFECKKYHNLRLQFCPQLHHI